MGTEFYSDKKNFDEYINIIPSVSYERIKNYMLLWNKKRLIGEIPSSQSIKKDLDKQKIQYSGKIINRMILGQVYFKISKIGLKKFLSTTKDIAKVTNVRPSTWISESEYKEKDREQIVKLKKINEDGLIEIEEKKQTLYQIDDSKLIKWLSNNRQYIEILEVSISDCGEYGKCINIDPHISFVINAKEDKIKDIRFTIGLDFNYPKSMIIRDYLSLSLLRNSFKEIDIQSPWISYYPMSKSKARYNSWKYYKINLDSFYKRRIKNKQLSKKVVVELDYFGTDWDEDLFQLIRKRLKKDKFKLVNCTQVATTDKEVMDRVKKLWR